MGQSGEFTKIFFFEFIGLLTWIWRQSLLDWIPGKVSSALHCYTDAVIMQREVQMDNWFEQRDSYAKVTENS
ncbi:hypothetical protein AAMO2058_001249700 [Amorphochlora amoebiformis]